MIPSIPFLESLAPHEPHTTSLGHVRAALVPRFASAYDNEVTDPAAQDVAPVADSSADVAHDDIPIPYKNAPPDTELTGVSAVAQPLPLERGVPRESNQTDLPRQQPAELQTVLASAPPGAPLVVGKRRAIITEPAGRREARSVRRHEFAIRAGAPISNVVRSQPSHSISPERPAVVHVTIDRIDVRAPATTSPPAPSPLKKRAESSQSLRDYLRQGGHSNRGGGGK